jgi:hypothetical protein
VLPACFRCFQNPKVATKRLGEIADQETLGWRPVKTWAPTRATTGHRFILNVFKRPGLPKVSETGKNSPERETETKGANFRPSSKTSLFSFYVSSNSHVPIIHLFASQNGLTPEFGKHCGLISPLERLTPGRPC